MITLESDQQLKDLIEEKPVILLFSADWCPDCRVIEPFLPELEEKYADWTFVYVDRDQFIHVCAENDVFGIPSFLAFRDGEEVGRFVSKDRKSQEEIEDFLIQVSR
ncbi:thioredoxin family protein [Halobacillus sp. ACCC02827]|uniref:thioredoxin family protein n=1 Tax=Bacillaceae TaxID=186817 RepID=UPI0002A4D07D|nr:MULTISPECIES: thioredoxin family protein [Bacillaceae]ELK47339.1 thioredoxin [Halobacillus sp. BAB-2008]QHT47451.1 thioredoxin family protein [Bacillus sp. SB49]WJE14676.1 thioredoxin family protein [Halobacillus sp. ACCC02827]